MDQVGEALSSLWRGESGRAEVWYTTITDPATGTGLWLHHEFTCPAGGADPHGSGLIAVFPPDRPPSVAQYGPARILPAPLFSLESVRVTADRLTGSAGPGWRWDLLCHNESVPLYTFPRWAWRSRLLPGAQIVPMPLARFTGTVEHEGQTLNLTGAPGATGHIYGHGTARRWAWLHADLGGGDVLEIVAAVARRVLMRRLPPLPFVRLRLSGSDWPAADPLLAAARFKARIGLPEWTVTGRWAGRRLTVTVTQPADRQATVPYTNPDGTESLCHNTERASATIVLERRLGGKWRPERTWHLDGTAHAEVGQHS